MAECPHVFLRWEHSVLFLENETEHPLYDTISRLGTPSENCSKQAGKPPIAQCGNRKGRQFVKNMIPGSDRAVAPGHETTHKTRWYKPIHCAVCTSSIWFSPLVLKEPIGAPEPRRTWHLCKSCHEALLIELRRSPIRSSLRLRIALGLIAAERSPTAYGFSTRRRDQRRIISIAVILFLAMLLHLAIVVALVTPLFK